MVIFLVAAYPGCTGKEAVGGCFCLCRLITPCDTFSSVGRAYKTLALCSCTAFDPIRVATLSFSLKRKSKLVVARPYQCLSPSRHCRRYTCPSEGVLNLVATGSETAGLIRRRRRRAPIGCGLCSCQSARTLPPPASDQSVILHGIERRCGDEETGRLATHWMSRRSNCCRLATASITAVRPARPMYPALKAHLHSR